jgi:hypothetical protein
VEEDIMDTPGENRRRWPALAAALAVAVVLALVVLLVSRGDEEEPQADDTPSSPAASGSPDDDSASPSAPGATAGTVPVYYVGDTPTGPRLFREFRDAEGSGEPVSVAVGMATSTDPLDPDYRVPWPSGTQGAAEHDAEGELITVDVSSESGTSLRDRPSGMSQAEAQMALEQLMYTAQAAVQARPPIRFLLDGEITDQLLGEPVSEPLAQGDPMEVQGTVWVISPQDGDTVSGELVVEGRGAFFEANVSWQVLRGDEVVREGYTTARECCTLAPYRFVVRDLPAGDYVLRVYDADMSDGEGPGEQQDTKRFTVGS